jgi:hypothetical protein
MARCGVLANADPFYVAVTRMVDQTAPRKPPSVAGAVGGLT